MVNDRAACYAVVHWIAESDMTVWLNNNKLCDRNWTLLGTEDTPMNITKFLPHRIYIFVKKSRPHIHNKLLESGKYHEEKQKWHDRDYSFMGIVSDVIFLSRDWVYLGRRTCDYMKPISGRRNERELEGWGEGKPLNIWRKARRPV